ncbi:ABC transporter substrate-binding protein [Oscillibacter valericigenes]|uniref:ABC transporter substrate-binding protein n=1 Tax=Oscillibacter valericigenes TaxID=351091 RepID=UPI001F204B28|nr:ABC transporter substrate-binding protein [Oscillibacter valericigenes]MCF2665249.1 ABC transporter substrate-binding protein [Oscillibacter valericigenes]
MKKLMAVLLALVMVLSLAACGGSKSDSQGAQSSGASGDKVVKIGVFEPQTGDNGAGGKQEILGMQYANYIQPTVEIGGETYQVQLEIVDNRTTPENGKSAAAELVNRNVSMVLGSYGSGVSMAGGEVFSEAGIPALGTSCTNPQVTAGCDVYFRLAFLDPFQGTVLANYAYKELGVDTAYVLGMLGSDYDQGLVYYFTEAFEGLGGTVVKEDFPEGSANFVSYINNAKSANAGVIFAPVSINYAQLIVEAAAAQGYEGALLGSDTWDSNKVIESATGKNVTSFVTTFYQEGGNAEFDAGIKEWINANADAKTNNGGNDMIAAVTAIGYDAYFTALEALKIAGSTDPKAVLEALPSVSFEGVTGLIEFDDIGDAKRDAAYIKTANTEAGTWDFVKVQTVG